jgi:hypothetical protein
VVALMIERDPDNSMNSERIKYNLVELSSRVEGLAPNHYRKLDVPEALRLIEGY